MSCFPSPGSKIVKLVFYSAFSTFLTMTVKKKPEAIKSVPLMLQVLTLFLLAIISIIFHVCAHVVHVCAHTDVQVVLLSSLGVLICAGQEPYREPL